MKSSRINGRSLRLTLIVGLALWGGVVGAGAWGLRQYDDTPGVAAHPPGRWPADSQIRPAGDRATLVMLAHPRCPCTRASLGELALLMAHAQGRVKAYVLFVRPQGFAADWERTDLWQSATSIPGVTAVSDPGGLEAERFGAATSGQALLYDARGNLLFSGGITGSRGHAGDNAGRDAVEALLAGATDGRTDTDVFGCRLFNAGGAERMGGSAQ